MAIGRIATLGGWWAGLTPSCAPRGCATTLSDVSPPPPSPRTGSSRRRCGELHGTTAKKPTRQNPPTVAKRTNALSFPSQGTRASQAPQTDETRCPQGRAAQPKPHRWGVRGGGDDEAATQEHDRLPIYIIIVIIIIRSKQINNISHVYCNLLFCFPPTHSGCGFACDYYNTLL